MAPYFDGAESLSDISMFFLAGRIMKINVVLIVTRVRVMFENAIDALTTGSPYKFHILVVMFHTFFLPCHIKE